MCSVKPALQAALVEHDRVDPTQVHNRGIIALEQGRWADRDGQNHNPSRPQNLDRLDGCLVTHHLLITTSDLRAHSGALRIEHGQKEGSDQDAGPQSKRRQGHQRPPRPTIHPPPFRTRGQLNHSAAHQQRGTDLIG